MMEKNNNYENFDTMVEKFLRHQMTASEEKEFKAELTNNPELATRAKTMALMIKSMQRVGIEQDQNLLNEIKGMSEAEFRKVAGLKPKDRVVPFWSKFIRYAAAACIAGLLCWGGIHYYGIHQTVNLGNTVDYYAYNMDISDSEYVRGTSEPEVIDELTGLFANVKDNKDLKETISRLESLYSESLNEDSEYNQYDNDIAWNLSIAYLKDGDRKKPVPILESMILRNKNYPEITQPVQALLDQIKGCVSKSATEAS